jgi:hypothetical protein
MGWILVCVLQFIVIAAGIRNEQRTGMWSWSKFVFAIGFGVLECTIVITPIVVMDLHDRHFLAVYGTCWVIAALNFIWIIIVARRWKLADGRTSLQAYRDHQEEPKAELKRKPPQQ